MANCKLQRAEGKTLLGSAGKVIRSDALEGGAESSGDFVAGWLAIFRTDAFGAFAQTQDVCAVRCKILFSVARVSPYKGGVGESWSVGVCGSLRRRSAVDGRADYIQQVAVG